MLEKVRRNTWKGPDGNVFNISSSEVTGPRGGLRRCWEIACLEPDGGFTLCSSYARQQGLLIDGEFRTQREALRALQDAYAQKKQCAPRPAKKTPIRVEDRTQGMGVKDLARLTVILKEGLTREALEPETVSLFMDCAEATGVEPFEAAVNLFAAAVACCPSKELAQALFEDVLRVMEEFTCDGCENCKGGNNNAN